MVKLESIYIIYQTIKNIVSSSLHHL